MDLRILGPLDARFDDGNLVHLPQRRHRELLAMLLVRPGQVTSTEGLIDAIWDHEPPSDPHGALRTRVYGLRRAFRPEERIIRSADGYSFKLADGDTLDLLNFLDLAERGRQQLQRGDNLSGAKLLQEAVGLWRAPTVVDLPASGPFAVHAERLAESRLAAASALFDARLSLGQHHDLIAELKELVAEDPGREHSWAQLLLALYRSGQRGMAIAVYSQARTALVRQFGMDPGPELVDLFRKIQCDDSSLDVESRAILQVTNPGSSSSPGGAAEPLVVAQMPPDIVDFVGRGTECRRLLRLLTKPGNRTGMPIAVISGTPGVGKSCLALHAAHCVAAEFPDGNLYMELAGSTSRPKDVGDVLKHALRALGTPSALVPESAQEKAALYRSTLMGKRIVVVIDDAPQADQVRLLLPGAPTCGVIITSRRLLSAIPGASLLQLDNLSHDEAIEMLGRIVGTGRAMAEPSAAAELVTACARLPLAIRIAGAKLSARPAWSLSVLTARLRGERRRLDELEIGDISVRAAVAISYRALSPRLQRAFRLLSLAGPNDFAEWFAAALTGESDARDVIDKLVHSSLLMPLGTDQAGNPRYRLHDLLRDFASEQVEAESAQDRDQAIARMLTILLELAQLARAKLPGISFFPAPIPRPDTHGIPASIANSATRDPLAWFASERKIMRAIAKLACATGHYLLAGQLAECLAIVHYFEGSLDEAEEIWNSVIAAASLAADHKAVAHAQLRLASVLAVRLRDNEATRLIDESIPIFERNCDIRSLAQAIYWRGHFASRRDDVETARKDAQRGLRLARMIDDKQTESLHLRMLAQALALLGDNKESVRLCEQALAIAREGGSLADQRQIIHELGEMKIAAGDPEWAVEQCRKELDQGFTMGYKFAEAYFRSLLGRAYHALGNYGSAIQELTSAVAIFARHKADGEYVTTLYQLASSQMAICDYDAAKENLTTCLEVLSKVRMPQYEDLARAALLKCSGQPPPDAV